MIATTATGTLPARSGRGEWPGAGGYSTLDVTRFFVIPSSAWEAVRTIRNHFPNGTGFYARGSNSEGHIQLLGEQFRKAPEGVTEPSYWFEMNQRDLRDLLAAIRDFAGLGFAGPPLAEGLSDRSIDASEALAALDHLPSGT